MRKEIFLDLETNQSLDPITGTITQIGIVYRIDGKIKKELFIDNNIYKSLITFLDSVINKFKPEDKAYFIAYNSKFDEEFIRQLFIRNGNKFYGSYFYNPSIDVMQIAVYKLMLKNKHPENFKLGTICKYFNVRIDDSKLHNALYDIQKTKELYNKLRKF